MSTELTTLFGAIGVVAALLAVILPAIRAQGANLRREIAAQGREIEAQGTSLRREIAAQGESLRNEIAAQGQVIETLGTSLRSEISALRGDVMELRRDVHDLSDRVSRIEGSLNGPRRSTNGTPAPAGSGATGDEGVAEGGE